MRVLTVSELKGQKRGDCKKSDYPKEGSFSRNICDALRADKWHTVDLSGLYSVNPRLFHSSLVNLRDMYGMDIRKVWGAGRSSKYVLAGEWFGAHYSDYCAQEFHKGNP